jgi:glycosyltransferase involved in cell wall biosynthesis
VRVTLALLVRDEIVGLRALADRIPVHAVDEVLAIDGGSTDGSVEYLRARGIRVVTQGRPGRGEAFALAFREASGDALVFFGPDGNEDPADVPRFRERLEAGADMVIGNRMTDGGVNEEDRRLLRWRKWANRAFGWLANRTWNRGPPIRDTINGFRAITRSAWERLRPDGPGYVIEYQCSIRAMKLGLRVEEFPTVEGQRLDPRRGSGSVATGLAHLRMYFRELHRGSTW